MKEYERKQLLERVEREGATVGADIPETIDVQGESVDLREFVFEIKRRETVAPSRSTRSSSCFRSYSFTSLSRCASVKNSPGRAVRHRRRVTDAGGCCRSMQVGNNRYPAV